MILNCTQKGYEKLKYYHTVPLICSYKKCSNDFFVVKKTITNVLSKRNEYVGYCCLLCKNLDDGNTHKVNCLNCKKMFYKNNSQFRTTKNHFCSRSCAATYNNKNKKYGSRRSKLEKYIQQFLKENYPELIVLYNTKEIIGSELDIYIPYFNLAIEVNGIFHYEPIYGEEKLKQIQKNDLEKKQKCKKQFIDLYTINASKQSYVNKKTSWKYIVQVINIINACIYE